MDIEGDTMWHKVAERTMPVGVASVDKAVSRFSFGAATVRAWKLRRYQSASPQYNDAPGLVAFQLYKNGVGDRRLLRAGRGGETLAVSCQRTLKRAGAVPGRYKVRKKEAGFLTVNFLQSLQE